MTLTYTPRFHLAVPDFLSEPWHAEFAAAMESIDQALFTAIVSQETTLWENDHVYRIGDIIIDPTTGTLYASAEDHTSSNAIIAPTFAAELAAHPNRWTSFAVTAASQLEAEQGTDNNKYMTPLRTKQAIQFQTPIPGIATLAQAQEQTDNATIMTPLRVGQGITARIATQLQAEAGTDNTTIMTPIRVQQQLLATGIAGGDQIGFSAHKGGTNQLSIPGGSVQTKVTFGTELYDLGNRYDTANSRWTPPNGLVHFDASIIAAGLTAGTLLILSLYKNGVAVRQANTTVDAAGGASGRLSIDDIGSGTDFYELFVATTSAGTFSILGTSATAYFMGVFLGEVGTVTLGTGQIGFRAHKNSVDQNIPNAANTKVTFGFEDYDQGARFDPALSRWTPPTGLVHIDGAIYFGAGLTANSLIQCAIFKNGALLKQGLVQTPAVQGGCQVSIDDIANGTDFYEIFALVQTPSIAPCNGHPANTYFAGHFLGGSQGATGPTGPAGPDGAITAPTMNCGRLRIVSATQLSFTPFNGDRIKINGLFQQIPASGIAGLANTSIFKNGVGAQNLDANTTFYVYAFLNLGVVTADFSTTGHATSATVGNVGTEIKTGDDTRTLIGMIRTNGTTFIDNAQTRFVLSWFNRRARALRSATGTNVNIGPGTWTTLNGASYVYALTWADEATHIGVWGYGWASYDQAIHWYAGISVDTTSAAGAGLYAYAYMANNLQWSSNCSVADVVELAEGYHPFYPTAYATAPNLYINILVTGMIQG